MYLLGWLSPSVGRLAPVPSSAPSSRSPRHRPRSVDGMVLLAVYSLGLGLPFILAALFLGSFVSQMSGLRRTGLTLRYVAGSIMIAMGVAMMTGHLTDVAFWFLETFPALGRIG